MSDYDDLEMLLYDIVDFIENRRAETCTYKIKQNISTLIYEFMENELMINEITISDLDLVELFYDLIICYTPELLEEYFKVVSFEHSDFIIDYINKYDPNEKDCNCYFLDEDDSIYYYE